MEAKVMRAFEKIPAFQQWQKVEAIHRGWSTDLKFKVTKNQETFLLRIFQQEERIIRQTTRISIYQKSSGVRISQF